MAKHYSKSVVLLNVPGVIDNNWIKQTPGLDSVLDVSQLGENMGTSVTNVLSGKVSPSGKLTTTWAKKYSDYPSSATFAKNDNNSLTEPYKEGIYVGYRYFDTYNKTPQYPFGYGLSYAKFKIKPQHTSIVGDHYSVSAKVTNTSKKYSGSEVVQAYYSKPKSNIPTAMQDLGGYAKTKTLKPGHSQTVKISFPIENMASFDTSDHANKLKAGNYLIRLGNSSRNTQVVSQLKLNKDFTVQKLSSQDAPKTDPTVLKGSNHQFTPKNQNQQIAKTNKLNINPSDLKQKKAPHYKTSQQETKAFSAKTDPKNLRIDRKKATLKNVYDGSLSLNEFVNHLNQTQLSNIVQGNVRFSQKKVQKYLQLAHGNYSKLLHLARFPSKETNVIPTSTGSITSLYTKKLGIPVMITNDGPAGLRFPKRHYQKNGHTYYTYATNWPSETSMAQSWDPENIYKEATGIAREMKEFGITTWLAPALNIQRNPLDGRNYEYYSEDPALSGISATAATRGVQKTPGLGVDVKHFAAHNQQTDRMLTNAQVGEQALRQIYLKGFEITAKNAQPQAYMSSYNKVNGRYNASNYDLLSHILRQEWGFKGMVTTDWLNVDSVANPKHQMQAGNDLIMPGYNQSLLRKENSGQDMKNMRRSAKRILKSTMKSRQFANRYKTHKHSYMPKKVSNDMIDNGNKW